MSREATRSPLRHPVLSIAYDRDGRLRGVVLLAIAAGAAMLVALGTMIAVALAGTGSPAAIAIWTTVAFVAVKIPLLALLWWLLGRHLEGPGEHRWDAEETREIMDRLRRAAASATGAPDAADRLEVLTDEAWYVADHAADDARSDAVELACEIRAERDRLTAPGSTPR